MQTGEPAHMIRTNCCSGCQSVAGSDGANLGFIFGTLQTQSQPAAGGAWCWRGGAGAGKFNDDLGMDNIDKLELELFSIYTIPTIYN